MAYPFRRLETSQRHVQTDHALMLSLDEKSQIRALDRTRPLQRTRPGIPAGQTHDYTRHGSESLLAALDVAMGKIIATCHRGRHQHQEFLMFLQRLDAQLPPPGRPYHH
jgi:hypothetical protein